MLKISCRWCKCFHFINTLLKKLYTLRIYSARWASLPTWIWGFPQLFEQSPHHGHQVSAQISPEMPFLTTLIHAVPFLLSYFVPLPSFIFFVNWLPGTTLFIYLLMDTVSSPIRIWAGNLSFLPLSSMPSLCFIHNGKWMKEGRKEWSTHTHPHTHAHSHSHSKGDKNSGQIILTPTFIHVLQMWNLDLLLQGRIMGLLVKGRRYYHISSGNV